MSAFGMVLSTKRGDVEAMYSRHVWNITQKLLSALMNLNAPLPESLEVTCKRPANGAVLDRLLNTTEAEWAEKLDVTLGGIDGSDKNVKRITRGITDTSTTIRVFL